MKVRLLVASVLACCFAWITPAFAVSGHGTRVLCYLWNDQPTSTIGVAITPSTFYSYNAASRAAGNTVTRTGTGTYTVTCKGAGSGPVPGTGTLGGGGHVQVTAYGSGGKVCNVGGWSFDANDITISVYCYGAPSLAPVNSYFDLEFIW